MYTHKRKRIQTHTKESPQITRVQRKRKKRDLQKQIQNN